MLRALTLVHKGAMGIALHSIRSFARNFANTCSLTIHTDPSTDDNDHQQLLAAANGMEVTLISAAVRGKKVDELLLAYPKTKEFLSRESYFAKLELPMYEDPGYFYFDSDIIWLRPVSNLIPSNAPNAFSTETWTWYPGVVKSSFWIKGKTPQRVNSGFHYLGQPFPFEKMEDMLTRKMFDRSRQFSGDQEIFAYLYNDIEYYHLEDFKRSRVGMHYILETEQCAALHFPGKMWLVHMDQIETLANNSRETEIAVRYLPFVALSKIELLRMKAMMKMGSSKLLAKPIKLLRRILRNGN